MASVIESLFFLFDSDASKLDAGLKESRQQNKKLGEEIDKTDNKVNKLGAEFVTMAKAAGGALLAAFSVGVIANTVSQVADFADAMNDSAQAIGISVTELEAWDAAALMTGGQAGAFTASLEQLNKGITTIATKGKGALLPFFEELGLSLADIKRLSGDPLEAMRELSDEFGKLSAAEAAAIGSKLGLDQGTINLLREGRIGMDEIIRRQKELGTLTQEQADAAAKFNDALDETKRAWGDLVRSLVVVALPVIETVISGFKNTVQFLKEHKTAAAVFFGAIAAVITAIYLPAMLSAAAATIAATWPILLVAGAIAAIAAAAALAADDLEAFLNGQDSVIGELAKKYPWLGDLVKDLALVMQWFFEIQKAGWKFISDLITEGPTKAFENLGERVGVIFDSIAARFPWLQGIIGFFKDVMTAQIQGLIKLWDLLKAAILGVWSVIKTVASGVGTAASWIGDKLGITTGSTTPEDTRTNAQRREDAAAILSQRLGSDTVVTRSLGGERARVAAQAAQGSQQLRTAAANPLAHTSTGTLANRAAVSSNTSKQTSVQIDKVEVNTAATDADGISRAAAGSLTTAINRAVDNEDDGLEA